MGFEDRILALDVGTVRIGVAVSDELHKLAFPLCTIHQGKDSNPIETIVGLISQYKVKIIVAGLPLKLDGTEGLAVRRTRRFLEQVKAAAAHITIVEVDERLTSMEAERALTAAEVSGKKKKNYVDNIAASIILQTYLDTH